MKKKFDNIYLKWAFTAFSVIAASILLYFFILRFNNIIKSIGKIFVILKPLLYGVILAFLLTQIYNYFDNKLTKFLIKKQSEEKAKYMSKILSIILSVLILLAILFLIFYVFIPKMVLSILGIIETWPTNMNNIEIWLEGLLKSSPVLEESVLSAINDSSTSILSWLSNALLPKMEMISDSVTTGLSDMYTFIKDFIIGIVFSVYILANKTKFIAGIKKFIYTICGIKLGNSIMEIGRYSYKIFNGFVKGKLITSLIIGTANYIGMIVLGLPYALLISIIIAVTNIIPFFGPIIGWIPSVILILMINPIQALYFTILNIILQQVEGNILEPKIVGNTTGISGFWVLFAIIVFEGLFGFVGMIFGVPVFAIIYHFVILYINKYLNKKDIPYNDEDYINLKYIDETTKKPVKLKNIK